MTERNTYKDQRRNSPKNHHSASQPAPLSGSHKVKKRNQVSQTNGEG
ncbi:small acid-soluble spore protein P [Evansella cellulosilytica]|uniref:Small acid-soluble spore P family protein n=1 Tax=Evansella cellulosilytica (strain ATCC 21833 / DSM 2522 / FERM P-1141 / JCM 9156 / N-4) TaxID=649639 RepID=E6U1N5_EVAC2|nr:small acid-soluble spore protein P [Evansella cellulosilytica]ADU30398.1 small acid-soluble spore P family protein [Evansella cellulosilytica DSM 2522]